MIEGGKLKDAINLYERMIEIKIEPILSPTHLAAIHQSINKLFKERFEKANLLLEAHNKEVVLTKMHKPRTSYNELD